MRFAVFLIMFALSMVIQECAGITEDENQNEKRENEDSSADSAQTSPKLLESDRTKVNDPVLSGNTITAAVPQQPLPQEKSTEEETLKSLAKKSNTDESSGVKEPKDDSVNTREDTELSDTKTKLTEPLSNTPVVESTHGQTFTDQSPPQQQQQQQHLSQPEKIQDVLQKHSVSGDALKTQNKPAQLTKKENGAQTESIVTPSKDNNTTTDRQAPNLPQQYSTDQGSTTSHSTETGVQKTQEKQLTATINKEIKTIKESTQPIAAVAPQLQDSVPGEKPAPISTAATHNSVNQTATTSGNKENIPAHSSVCSTWEPVNGEFTPSVNSSKKLSSDLQSLDKTDSSIRSSSLFVFTALATLFLLAVEPAS